MRLFITSYQKSGTHQIMPALIGMSNQIVGRVYIDVSKIQGYEVSEALFDRCEETCKQLREFDRKSFGHLPYLPEYAQALQEEPTKVLFNVRDPRDIVVANYHNILKVYHKSDPPGKKGLGHLNFVNKETGKLLIEMDDPISELIKIESCRWPEWLGWLQHDFVMQVKYEDLRTNPQDIVSKIAEFVSPYPVDVNIVIGNLKPRHSNPTFRAGRVGDWKTEFNDEQKELAKKLLGNTIEKLGYEV